MDMDRNIFSGLGFLFKIMLWLLAVFVPLGLWKLVDIVVWIFIVETGLH
jgi:hypothetical protein